MLTVVPTPDLVPDDLEQRLWRGATSNPHGSGWAVIQSGLIVTGKSMEPEEAVDGFMEALKSATGPAMFHSRWATHGYKGLANVHPFQVGKYADTFVAHNGIMPMDAWPEDKDPRSDTRVFADEILPQRFDDLDDAKVRLLLSRYLGGGNKIAVLTTDAEFAKNLYLINHHLGNWKEGVWFSNYDHESSFEYGRYSSGWPTGTTSTKPAASYSAYGKPLGTTTPGGSKVKDIGDGLDELDESVDDADCTLCDARGSITLWKTCDTCRSCLDCESSLYDCQCFTPGASTVLDSTKETVDA